MENIGVILPCEGDSVGFLKRFFNKSRYEILPVKEYGFEFLCVYDYQNYIKIFNKKGIENIVVMTDKPIEKCNFRILSGDRAFKHKLTDFVRKTVKSFGNGCSVTIVDKNLSGDVVSIIENLSAVCGEFYLCTSKTYDGEKICDRLLDRFGIVAEVKDNSVVINSDIAVVLEDWGNKYHKDCLVIDKNSKSKSDRVINDFHIPFRIKPPFGMSNLVFAECLDAINK